MNEFVDVIIFRNILRELIRRIFRDDARVVRDDDHLRSNGKRIKPRHDKCLATGSSRDHADVGNFGSDVIVADEDGQ